MYDYEKNVEIKRKIRELKKLEKKIQDECAHNLTMNVRLIQHELLWNTFFSLNEEEKSESKYSMNQLMKMTKEELKTVIDEFLGQIFDYYYTMIKQEEMIRVKNDVSKSTHYEDGISEMREFMKECHPDNGGDSAIFIEVLEKYRQLKKELDSKNHADESL